MAQSPEIDLTIGSSFEELEFVDLLMDEVARWAGLSEEDAVGVALAVREAAANAIRHGNQLQEGKRVGVCASLGSDGLTVVIRDEGEGFDSTDLPDPLAPLNLLKRSGRGIFLIRKFMDEVVFDFPPGGGTVVTMRKKTPFVSAARAGDPPASL
jgi:serine/threonine-protein kinase RsbW